MNWKYPVSKCFIVVSFLAFSVVAEEIKEPAVLPPEDRELFANLVNHVDGFQCTDTLYAAHIGSNHTGTFFLITCRSITEGTYHQYLINNNRNSVLVSQLNWIEALYGEGKWLTTIYSDKNNLTNYLHLGIYPTLHECRNSAKGFLQKNGWAVKGTYECGLNCNKDADLDIFVCKETRQ